MPWSQPKQTTTARGYGAEHQAERKRRLPLFSPTDPCTNCGEPLGHDRKLWHLPHNDTRTGYLPGFWCASCNIKDGARRGRARQSKQQQVTTLRW